MDITELTAVELARGVRARELSATEVTAAFVERAQRLNPQLNAFVTITPERAMEQARAVDAALGATAKGSPAGASAEAERALAPLAGVPVALKDNLCVEGIKTTCGSRILEPFRPIYTATAVRRLFDRGACLLGKTNMDEFAMGSSTEHSAWGAVRNPWDLDRVPGGSSGGSAVAVAARLAPLALGSDTGGSIRQPAALSGVVGLKPTYGAVSRYGLVAFASSLDQIGPFARTVEDAAIGYAAMAGKDPRDSTSVELSVDGLLEAMRRDIRGLRVGVVREMMGEGIGQEARASIEEAAKVLERLGARVDEVSIPHIAVAVPTYYVIACAEASSNLARYDGVRYGLRTAAAEDLGQMFRSVRETGFGPEVKRRIMLGTFVLSSGYYDAYYARAQKVRTLIRREFDAALSGHDLLVGPTSPTPAFRQGEKSADPLAMYLADICTISVNLAGLPGISLPCSPATSGLPLGLQLVGRAFDEATLLRAGYNYQTATDHHRRSPPAFAG